MPWRLIALGGGGLALVAAFGLWQFNRAESWKTKADERQATIETLTTVRAADDAALSEFQKAAKRLGDAANGAALKLEKARREDATLDACLRYDPGVDITGMRNEVDNEPSER